MASNDIDAERAASLNPPRPGALAKSLRDIAEELRGQYSIGFTPGTVAIFGTSAYQADRSLHISSPNAAALSSRCRDVYIFV